MIKKGDPQHAGKSEEHTHEAFEHEHRVQQGNDDHKHDHITIELPNRNADINHRTERKEKSPDQEPG
jgi:hypothetical protein